MIDKLLNFNNITKEKGGILIKQGKINRIINDNRNKRIELDINGYSGPFYPSKDIEGLRELDQVYNRLESLYPLIDSISERIPDFYRQINNIITENGEWYFSALFFKQKKEEILILLPWTRSSIVGSRMAMKQVVLYRKGENNYQFIESLVKEIRVFFEEIVELRENERRSREAVRGTIKIIEGGNI